MAIKNFRLVRYFTATSLVAFVLVAAVLGYVFRQVSVEGLVRTQEDANVNLTRVFSNTLWANDFGPFVQAMQGRPAAELKAAPAIAELHRKVLALMKGSTTFKVKVYDLQGMTVYSTELKQIGEDKRDNAGVVAALAGATTSELVHRNTFSALEREVQNRDLIQSYIPQHDPASGALAGVFEVYSDVTPFLAEIATRQWVLLGTVAGLLALLYAALFVIVNIAQGIIRRQSKARYRQMFEDNASIGCLVDPDTGRIVDANTAASEFWGYPPGTLRGMSLAELSAVPRAELAAMMQGHRERRAHRSEWRSKLRGGEVREVEVFGSPLYHQGRALLYYILHDVTERKRAEEALRRNEAELNRSKSEFLSAAAHELRTPMSSIFGFSELLRTRKLDPEATRDIAETIHAQAARLVHLLNELLDLSRIEARAVQAFDFRRQPIAEIAQSAAAELLVPGDARRAQVEIEPGLPPLRVDRSKIKQALTNILSNAYKFSPPEAPIALKVFREGERVGIRVTDCGIGMSARELEHFAERFWRAPRVHDIPGSGLGMSLVKEIVRFHRGSVEARSELARGTEITIWLPCDETITEAAAAC